MSTNTKYLLLLVITLVGFLIRIYHVDVNPPSMYWDEAAIAYDAYSIATTGKDMHGNYWLQAIFPSYGDYKLPLYIWSSAIFMKLFGPSVLTLRLTSVLAGTLLIPLTYLLTLLLTKSRKIGLIAALAIAVSPWSVHFSRIGFEANLGVLLLTSALTLLVLGVKRPYLIALAWLVGGIGVYAYFSVRFVFPLFALIILLFNWRKLNRTHLPMTVIGILVFWLMLLPMNNSPWYQASNQFRLSTPSLLNTNDHIVSQNSNRELDNNSIISRLLYHRYVFFLKRVGVQISEFLSGRYLFMYGDPNLRHGTGQTGLLFSTFVILVPLMLLWVMKYKKKLGLMLGLLILAALVPALVPLNIPHALRSLNAMPILAILIGLGMGLWWAHSRMLFKQLMIGIIAAIFVLQWSLYIHDYWEHYPLRSSQDWQYGYRQLAEYLHTIDDDYEKIFVTNTDGRIFLYFLFHQLVDPERIQGTADDFQFLRMGKYQFQRIFAYDVEKYQAGELFVMTPEEYNDIKQSLVIKKTLTNLQGEDQFLVVATDEQIK